MNESKLINNKRKKPYCNYGKWNEYFFFICCVVGQLNSFNKHAPWLERFERKKKKQQSLNFQFSLCWWIPCKLQLLSYHEFCSDSLNLCTHFSHRFFFSFVCLLTPNLIWCLFYFFSPNSEIKAFLLTSLQIW